MASGYENIGQGMSYVADMMNKNNDAAMQIGIQRIQNEAEIERQKLATTSAQDLARMQNEQRTSEINLEAEKRMAALEAEIKAQNALADKNNAASLRSAQMNYDANMAPYRGMTAAQEAEVALQKEAASPKRVERTFTAVSTLQSNLGGLTETDPVARAKAAATYANTALTGPVASAVGKALFTDAGDVERISFATTLDGRLIPSFYEGGKRYAVSTDGDLVPYDKKNHGMYTTVSVDELRDHAGRVAAAVGGSRDAEQAAVTAERPAETSKKLIETQTEIHKALQGAQEVKSQGMNRGIISAVDSALAPHTEGMNKGPGGILARSVGTSPVIMDTFNVTKKDAKGGDPASLVRDRFTQNVQDVAEGSGDKDRASREAMVAAGIIPTVDIANMTDPKARNNALRQMAISILALREMDPAAVDDGITVEELQAAQERINGYRNQPLGRSAPVYKQGLGSAVENIGNWWDAL